MSMQRPLAINLAYHGPKRAKYQKLSHKKLYTWWRRHQMETLSALLAIYARNSPVTSEFPAERPVTRSFDFFYLRLNKRLGKQSWGWWFETPLRPLWRHCYDISKCHSLIICTWWHPWQREVLILCIIQFIWRLLRCRYLSKPHLSNLKKHLSHPH